MFATEPLTAAVCAAATVFAASAGNVVEASGEVLGKLTDLSGTALVEDG
jgi:hypothetical protein